MKRKVVVFLLAVLPAVALFAQQVKIPAKESFHIFLLAGQSNMAGRGKVADEDKVPHPRVLMLAKDGQWKPAVDPLHFDKSAAGVCLARTFGLVLADKEADITVGLVPAACGGSSIESWVPGGYHGQTKSHPYDDAIERARKAVEKGVLKGILWHQGESDSGPGRAEKHEKLLRELVERFRKELDAQDLPFVIGQLGQFDGKPWDDGRKTVDAAQKKVAVEVPNCAFVSSE